MMLIIDKYGAEKPKQRAMIEPQLFDTYAGKYDLGGNRSYLVIREGDRYFGKTGGGQREMFPVTETKFILPEAESQITFVKDDKGEVVEMLYDQNGRVIRYKRIKEGAAGSGRSEARSGAEGR